jgi:hypothetical protein
MTRKALCCCGASFIEVAGEPTLNAVCCCDDCWRRTGSAFGWSAYFPDAQVVATGGDLSEYRIRDEQVRSFCSRCGTTLFWTSGFMPDETGIAGGAFLDPPQPEPTFVATAHKCPNWLALPAYWGRWP